MKNKMITISVIIILIVSLCGCSAPKPNVDDGPVTMHYDTNAQTEYANVLDFDHYDGQPMFAVAFLGYGDRMDYRNNYIEKLFESLSDESVEKIQHFDFEGDEWYLVVPQYQTDVDIMDCDGNLLKTVYHGEAFTVKCNISDLYSNLEISTEHNLGGYKFSPQIGGDGRIITNADMHDITDYSVMN